MSSTAPRGALTRAPFFYRLFFNEARLRPTVRVLVYGAAAFVALALTDAFLAPIAGLPGSSLLERAAACAVLIGLGVLCRRLIDRRSIDSLGLSVRVPWLRFLCVGAVLGAGMQCALFGLGEALGFSHVSGMNMRYVDGAWLGYLVVFFAVAALAEEFPIRGYVLQNLWEAGRFWPAALLSAALFAALHFGNPHAREQFWLTTAGLLAYGVWTAISVRWTGSIWLALGSHVAWNAFEGLVFGFPVSGVLFTLSLVRQTTAGPLWFTGGSFGPEAGTGALIVLAIGLAAMYAMRRAGLFASAFDPREPYAR